MQNSSSLAPYAARVWTQKEAQEIDRLSIASFDRRDDALMEEAGRACAAFLHQRETRHLPILVLAGQGNNGGDALVAARHLHTLGHVVHLWLVGDQNRPSPLQEQMRKACQTAGMALHTGEALPAGIDRHMPCLVMDGVYGLGFHSPWRDEKAKQALLAVAALPHKHVYAIDLPSGLSTDAWAQAAPPLAAHTTLTFGNAKPCHVIYPARRWCGETQIIPLDFALGAIDAVENARSRTGTRLYQCQESLLTASPWRHLPPDAHKFQRGHLLVAGGDEGTTGAAYLAGMAALRAGAGWVTLMTKARVGFQASHPELTQAEAWVEGRLQTEVITAMCRERHARALVLGPGLREACDPSTWEALAHCQKDYGLFLLIDAGALQDFMPHTQGLRFDPARTLLTPHPGEWHKMFGALAAPPLQSLADLPAAQAALATRGVTVIYKSASPLVLSPLHGNNAYLCAPGTLSLGKAGSGDVLSGTAGAHGAAGADAAMAAARAYACLAAAARLAAETVGPHGVIASDLIAHIGKFN